jgi:hypothetical protein
LTKETKKDKVIILGYCPYTLADVPWNLPDFEYWGMNDLYLNIPKADRWFEMHIRELIEKSLRNQEHLHWLKTAQIPIYMIQKHDDIPMSKEYPLQKILKEFQYGNYLTNSCSFMIALAILEGFKEIRIYGIDMASDRLLDREYGFQRPSCEYWLGVAAGRGIKIFIPPKSDLLKKAYLYGYEEDAEKRVKIEARSTDMSNQIAQMEQQKRNLLYKFHEIIAREDNSNNESIQKIKNEYAALLTNLHQIDVNEAKFQGSIDNSDYILRVWSARDELKYYGDKKGEFKWEKVGQEPMKSEEVLTTLQALT